MGWARKVGAARRACSGVDVIPHDGVAPERGVDEAVPGRLLRAVPQAQSFARDVEAAWREGRL